MFRDKKGARLDLAEKNIQKAIEEVLFPHLKWMIQLKNLVLVKLGPFASFDPPNESDWPLFKWLKVKSLLLEDLLFQVFSNPRSEDSFQCLWLQDFEIHPYLINVSLKPILKSYCARFGPLAMYPIDHERDGPFDLLENLNGLIFDTPPSEHSSSDEVHHPSLKFVQCICSPFESGQQVHKFPHYIYYIFSRLLLD